MNTRSQETSKEALERWCTRAGVTAFTAPAFSCAFAVTLNEHLHLAAVITYGALATAMIGTLINSLINVFLAALAVLKEAKS